MLLLVFSNQPEAAQPGHANLSLALDDLWSVLNATGPSDAVFWTAAEFYEWFDEAAKKLARDVGIFVVRDETITTSPTISDYDLPANHVSTVQLDLSGRTLKARSVPETEALDSDWTGTQGEPKAFLLDTQGFERLTLYPRPEDGDETIGMVNQILPATITASSAIVPVCPLLREYFSFRALAGALSKETPASKDEVVPWLNALCGMYESAATQLWGGR